MYCQRFKTRAGAERYIARQETTYDYTIQKIVWTKAWWQAGVESWIAYAVYLNEEA